MDPTLTVFVVLLWAVVGLLMGVLLDRLAYLLPRDAPLASVPACDACGAPIRSLTLRGSSACARCGHATQFDRAAWILAGLYALLALRFGWSSTLMAHSLYTAVLLLIAMVDWRHRYVYTIVVYPTIAAALLLTPAATGVGILETGVGLALGAAVFVGVYAMGRLLYRGSEAVGKGDVEIGALVGVMLGFPKVIQALFLGMVVNAVFVLALLAARRRSRRDFVPYGPGLCVGAFVAMLM